MFKFVLFYIVDRFGVFDSRYGGYLESYSWGILKEIWICKNYGGIF